MPQNIYDNDEFFAGYSELPRSVDGLSAAPEWAAVRALLPDLKGTNILDLGCGFGAFDCWAIEQGARSVLGIDLSENMLNRARALASTTSIQYQPGDISALEVRDRFDLIYSALAFHYVADIHSLCRDMRARLVDGGRLVATVEHPIFSAPSDDQWREKTGRKPIWPLDGYLNEGPRSRSWFTDGVIKHHRTIETYLTALLENGFQLTRLIEWGPDSSQLLEHPEWYRERERPMFLLFAAKAV